MAPSSHPTLVGHSVHGMDRQTVLQLHQQALEKTLQSTITMIDNSSEGDYKRNFHNKKKKKYYPWLQRDSLARRDRIGNPGSRRRQRHDNDKFVDHPCAVLYHVDLAFPGYGHDAPTFHWKYDAVVDSLLARAPQHHPPRRVSSLLDGQQPAWERVVAQRRERERHMAGHHRLTRAQRKDIKKAHVPQGIVKHYEGELVSFLDQLPVVAVSSSPSTTTTATSAIAGDSTGATTTTTPTAEPLSGRQEDGQRILRQEEKEEEKDKPKEEGVAISDSEPSPSLDCANGGATLAASTSSSSSSSCAAKTSSRVYLRWEIQDRFLRFVAHALCSFYGMVSFTKTCTEGKQWMYVCHPEHLDSLSKATAVSVPTPAQGQASRRRSSAGDDEDKLMSALSKLSLSSPRHSIGGGNNSSKNANNGHHQLKSLDLIETMSLTELDRLWPTVAGCKVESCLAPPETTFFEYLFPTTRLNI